ncbi:MAG TPA: SRPBCC domain-containing protein [Actinomycetota bacterium]|nr:SRPBCC domain-containing protein [Actinomycetota bacterium]
MKVPDEIRKHLELDAPIERVWAALTTPDGLLAWFPTHAAEIDLRPGGRLALRWADDGDEGVVDVVEPPRRLVFRWRPEGRDRPFTTVAFTLEDLGDRTGLTLVESGSTSLPDQIHQQAWEGNDRGWDEELAELKASLEAA